MRVHCLQVGNLDHHPALYVSAELKHLKVMNVIMYPCTCTVPPKTLMVFQVICDEHTVGFFLIVILLT